MPWQAMWSDNDDGIHVIPLDDTFEHSLQMKECLCGPRVEGIICGDGQFRYQYIHNSFDGREHAEEDHDKLRCPLCSSQVT